jgi:hypothetical protein
LARWLHPCDERTQIFETGVRNLMGEQGAVVREDSWTAWPVYWSPVIVGALASVVAVVLFGVIGTAVGSWKAGNEGRVTDFSGVGRVAVAYAVFASFFAFVIGGWVTARIAGIRRAETAILHAAIAFLVATVVLLAMASFGGAVFNGWYAGLAPSPAVPAQAGQPLDPSVAKAAAAGATAAAVAILLGLLGSVIGGWMGSGERMDFSFYSRERGGVTRRVASDRTTRI